MAVNRKPKIKTMRRFGMLPEGMSKRKLKKGFRKKSDFGARLEEKQKLKFIYGIMERQLHRYARDAMKSGKDPSEVILRTLETRLDNIVYRLGFARTRKQARQMVTHGHVKINDKKVDIPSYNVASGQKIILELKKMNDPVVKEFLAEKKPESIPAWLKRENNVGEMIRLPASDELRQDIDMSYIMEFYS